MKEYTTPKLEFITFDTQDICTASILDEGQGDNELPMTGGFGVVMDSFEP